MLEIIVVLLKSIVVLLPMKTVIPPFLHYY